MKNKKPPGFDYIKYSGIAFQMIGMIVICTFGGLWLDKKTAISLPIFTLLGILIGIAASLYYVLKKLK